MLRYFGNRLLAFIPTLIIISMVAFALSRLTPGDPVECGFEGAGEMTLGSSTDRDSYQKLYVKEARDKGLDKPYFYFSLNAAAYPDTLYLILDRYERETRQKMIAQYGNWEQISAYFSSVDILDKALAKLPKNQSRDEQIKLFRSIQQLKVSYQKENITGLMNQMEAVVEKDSFINDQLAVLIRNVPNTYKEIERQSTPGKLYLPAFHWQGTNNQYHHWISRFFMGDFGVSCRNGQPVFDRIKSSLWWTLVMSIPSLLLAFAISIPLGVYAAIKPNSWFDRVTTLLLFILYSLPSFWVATLLIVFFTTKEYGWFMDVFPSVGLGELPSDAPLWDRFWETSSHLILPIFCMTYASLAFITRQMRNGVLEVFRQDYIRTAQAKGLPESKVLWKHVFRNSLFPLITMVAIVLPNLISGAVVIEVIFNIPGMGRETVEAIQARDWPVVYTVLMMAALLTLIGNLLGDFLYAWADPRVSYSSAN